LGDGFDFSHFLAGPVGGVLGELLDVVFDTVLVFFDAVFVLFVVVV
jgi:hypothetical protein